MKKKAVLTIAVLMILIVVIGISKLLPSYRSVLESNWGISLPVKAVLTETYEKDSGASSHGDGVRYHVFSYKYEDYIDLMFAWSPNEHETVFYPTTREAAEAWLDEIEVPSNERPDYSKCCSWSKTQDDNSEIIIFWDNNLNKLYIVENFI
ncbi:MAG: hypothetical protein IJB86_07295 [Clostridia bacterium]|nr:hypothetical protein [Clostridia bacterium]